MKIKLLADFDVLKSGDIFEAIMSPYKNEVCFFDIKGRTYCVNYPDECEIVNESNAEVGINSGAEYYLDTDGTLRAYENTTYTLSELKELKALFTIERKGQF